ncbi:hypothetical protein M1M30_gp143 [Maribacter phage Colly_1]|uniref:Uncharacterized protein n=1 Tax=Maribacter phage Colly_1 TaxID=2745691 RepID=A0A8E4UXV0_9CAUD|nr:hypothetical protein M1M30_gp143 [Maribacter phage Colly_1]QQO97244.1 hypothetical protein Colly1_143 [Maribacter phage Colly_1]
MLRLQTHNPSRRITDIILDQKSLLVFSNNTDTKKLEYIGWIDKYVKTNEGKLLVTIDTNNFPAGMDFMLNPTFEEIVVNKTVIAIYNNYKPVVPRSRFKRLVATLKGRLKW